MSTANSKDPTTTIPKVRIEDIENGGGGDVSNDVTERQEGDVETEEEEAARRYVKFTPETFKRQLVRQAEEKLKEQRASQLQEGRLVDGTLVFGDGEDDDEDKIDFDPYLQEGCNVPEDYPPIPRHLIGVPIEEIDRHIKETVGYFNDNLAVFNC